MLESKENLAEHVLGLAKSLGVDEVKVSVSRSTHVELDQRDGVLEKSNEAVTQGLTLSIMVDDRSSAHSTSDLRAEALKGFVKRAVDATLVLEPDPDHRLLPFEEMGSLVLEDLDLVDRVSESSANGRCETVAQLENAVLSKAPENLISATTYLWESQASSTVRFSNGFSAETATTQYGVGGEVTLLEESGKRPEANAFYSSRHLDDLPGVDAVAEEIWRRSAEGLDAKATHSGECTLILANRSVGRILGALLGPLSGSAIWQGRSLYADKLGEQIASARLDVYDDPGIPRGHGSRAFDKDGLPPRKRAIVKEGVLQTWLLDAYHSRKLEKTANGGSLSNLIVPAGSRSWREIASEHPRAIRVTSFLGGNTNATSGDFSFGIRGQLVESGEVVQNVVEMNVAGNMLDLMSNFTEAANDPWMYSSYRVPTLIFEGVQFSGT